MIVTLLAVAVFSWTAWTAYTLLKHYRQAQCLEVPILISPIGVSNLFWLIFQEALIPYIERLPFGLGSWTRYNKRSWIWQFSDRDRIHQEYGPIIAHVTPSEIQIWIADKDVALELLKGKDRAQFDKPREEIERVDFLGPHLMTACGETWKRHRRIVATPFTQRNNRIVWKESLHQGLILGKHWFSNFPNGVDSVWKDNETTAMNVMVTAGFGLSRDNHKDLADKRTKSLDFHSSLSFVVEQFIWVVLIPSKLWFPKNLPPFPESLRNFFKSIRAFKEHLDRMVTDSKALAGKRESEDIDQNSYAYRLRSDNLLTALVYHSEEAKRDDEVSSSGASQQKNSLTDDEIYSNLFGLAFAGHETTAHTLAYSLFLLATHPHIQSWVSEEVHAVLKDSDDMESLDMDDTYPRLVRTKAIMYETLRLFTPLANVLKKTLSGDGAVLHIGSRTLSIPPRAFVLPSLYALHSREEYWGKDSLEWNPKRWITVDEKGQERFEQPSPPGTFLPWSDGPRVCPGARFSQVEFVAVCAALFFHFKISPIAREGESEGDAIGRYKTAIWDSTSVVTLMIKNPERIPLRLESASSA